MEDQFKKVGPNPSDAFIKDGRKESAGYPHRKRGSSKLLPSSFVHFLS